METQNCVRKASIDLGLSDVRLVFLFLGQRKRFLFKKQLHACQLLYCCSIVYYLVDTVCAYLNTSVRNILLLYLDYIYLQYKTEISSFINVYKNKLTFEWFQFFMAQNNITSMIY